MEHDDDPNFDLSRLTRPQQAELLRRKRLLDSWQAVRRTLPVAWGIRGGEADKVFVAEMRARGERLSLKTLYNWRRAYRADGLLGLADHRWLKGRPLKLDGRFLAELERVYLLPLMPPVEVAHDLARHKAERCGWTPCTLRESQRHIREHVLPRLTRERGDDD